MASQTVATKKRRAWTTTVFVKQLMAISGIVFVLFLLFHSYGNLKMFLGQDAYDHYAHWLKEEAFVPIFPHVVKRSAADAYAARTMRMTGVLLFFLIVFHILHFTTGTVRTGFTADSTPYERMVATFHSPLMVVVYLIFVGLAALHVSHGFWSAFQSLGWVRGGTRKFMEIVSGLVGALIFLMFALPPLAIVAGYIS